MISSILADHLELWGFESGSMVYKDFSIGRILKIEPVDASCFIESDFMQIKNGLCQALNSLPTGARVQFFQEIKPEARLYIDKFLATIKTESDCLVTDLAQEKAELLKTQDLNGKIPTTAIYLIVRLPFENKPKSSNFLKDFLDGFLKSGKESLSETHLQNELSGFDKSLSKIRLLFQSTGLKSEELNEDEMYQLVFKQWNPDLEIKSFFSPLSDVRDQLIQTDQVMGLDSFSLGRIHHKVLSLKMLPEMTFTSMIEVMRSLPFGSGLYLSIEVLDQEKERSHLETQRRVAFSTVVGKSGVADLDSEAKLKDLEGLLSEVVQGSEKVFKVSLNVVVKSNDLDDLDSQVSEVLYKFRELSGSEGFLETYACFDVYKEIALPNAKGRIRSKKMNTSVLADFIPAFGLWSGHQSPRVLMKTTEGSLFGFDPFSSELSNSNQLVSGGSGSGKSFLCNLLVLQMLKEKPKVFILDIGGSYKRLCENLGGQYIELGIKSNQSFNPLDMSGLSGSDEEIFNQKIKFLVSLIDIMTKENELSSLGRLEKSEIEKIVSGVLKTASTGCFKPGNKATPVLSDIQAELLNHEDVNVQRIGKILSLWCGDSPYGKFTDRPTSVDLQKDVICFDLKGMESHPDLQAATLFIITDLIWREVQRDRTQMKICVMDECWRLLQSESACLFIGDIFRTFRKYMASAVAISQTVADFSKSKVAQAIMPNSSIKWILRQKGDPKEVKSALNLNDREMAHINDLVSVKGKYSEVFLMSEDKRQVLRIEASPLEYWIATTDPFDFKILAEIRNTHPEISEIEVLKKAAQKFPQGGLIGENSFQKKKSS